jgi:hypothetical protein
MARRGNQPLMGPDPLPPEARLQPWERAPAQEPTRTQPDSLAPVIPVNPGHPSRRDLLPRATPPRLGRRRGRPRQGEINVTPTQPFPKY